MFQPTAFKPVESKRRTRSWMTVVVLALAALTVTACDDDDSADDADATDATDSTDDATTDTVEFGDISLSEEQYVAQANEICSAGNERLDALGEDIFTGTGEPTAEQNEEFFDALVADIRTQIADISALDPPNELTADVAAFLEQANDDLDALEETGPEALEGSDPFTESNALATELGLTECGG